MSFDGYPLDSPHPNGLRFGRRFLFIGVDDLVVGHRIDGNGLLSQAKEQFPSAARSAAIESERELVQVVVLISLL